MDTPYHQRLANIFNVNHNIFSILATRTFQNLAVRRWAQLRRDEGQHIYQNELSIARQFVLDGLFAYPLKIQSGAYIPIERLHTQIVELYTHHQAFADSETLWWKVSADNRNLWHKNEAWTLSPLSVFHSQSYLHVYDFMTARIKETNINFTSCVSETDMEEFLTTFDGSEIMYNEEKIPQKLFIGGDWQTHVCELNATPANTANLLIGVCWRCGIHKEYLRNEWYNDPFNWHADLLQISDFPNAAYSFLPLEMRRYCLMHGVSNLLSNCLKLIYNRLLPRSRKRGQMKDIMELARHNWDEEKPLPPHLMKRFFTLRLQVPLSQVFELSCQIYQLKWNVEPFSFLLTYNKIVEMLLDSVRVYKEFAYKEHPDLADLQCLLIARTAILSVHARFHWWLAPTTHFLTNHSIDDIREDRTGYHTLQEGPEANNRYDRTQGRTTFTGDALGAGHESPYEYLLNQQTLRHIFVRTGYAPPSHQLPLATTPSIHTAATTISPPAHAPTTLQPGCHWF